MKIIKITKDDKKRSRFFRGKLAYIETDNGCHEVIFRCKSKDGHVYCGRTYAHRIAYKIYHGLIPDGMVVMHSCDNPACINPKHLLLGTQADNQNDKAIKGRQAIGAFNGRAKLTASQVKRILTTNENALNLAKKLKVDRSLIYKIRRREFWQEALSKIAFRGPNEAPRC